MKGPVKKHLLGARYFWSKVNFVKNTPAYAYTVLVRCVKQCAKVFFTEVYFIFDHKDVAFSIKKKQEFDFTSTRKFKKMIISLKSNKC